MGDNTVFDILIIEDDEITAKQYEHQLNKNDHNFNFTICYDLSSGMITLKSKKFDAVLLDLGLPDSKFEQTLKKVKAISRLAPVLVATSKNDRAMAIQALNYGAQDFITKDDLDFSSFSRNIIYAKERFELMMQEQKQKKASHALLSNMLPNHLITELRDTGVSKTKDFNSVSIMFTDFVGFTKSSSQVPVNNIVKELENNFDTFDGIIEKYHIEKIKTIGDSYMAASGLPIESRNHAILMVLAAIEIKNFIKEKIRKEVDNLLAWEIRIGINTGPVMAGITGKSKFAYDVWGDTVNIASRLESHCTSGNIQISESCYQLVKEYINCNKIKKSIPDLEDEHTYIIISIKPKFSIDSNGIFPKKIWLNNLLRL